MSDLYDKYRHKFAAHRLDTLAAIVDVWDRMPQARANFGGFTVFSEFAVAQKRLQDARHDDSDYQKVVLARNIMVLGGYESWLDHKGTMCWRRKVEKSS